MSWITLYKYLASLVPTPESGGNSLFVDESTEEPSYKDDAGNVHTLVGAEGPVGPTGPAGADGADGEGVPTGGTTNQVLAKASNADFDTAWVDPSVATYTNEDAQDAVGAILTDSATVDFTYDDGIPSISAAVIPGGIKLDDLGAPDDNTDLNVSVGAHGLTPKLPNDATKFLNGVGGWTVPGGTVVVTLPFLIDGGGSAITTGVKGDVEIGFAGTITGWRLLADQSGSIVVDSWKDTYANFPPVVADTIWGTKPSLSSADKNEATGLSIAVAAGDIIRFNVDSAATVTRVTLSLTISRT